MTRFAIALVVTAGHRLVRGLIVNRSTSTRLISVSGRTAELSPQERHGQPR